MSALPHLVVMQVAEGATASSAASAIALAVEEPAAVTLYGAEAHLEALRNCLDLVLPEQEEELVQAIGAALSAAVDKRDRLSRFLGHIDHQIAYGKDEIRRLKTRLDLFEAVVEKIEGYVARVIVGLGKDAKGKWRKLEGNVSTLGVKNLPASVELDDETQVPTAYRRATVTLSAQLWEEIIDALPVELSARLADEAKRTDEAMKSLIKSGITGGTIVPGAHLATDRVKLVRA